METDKLALLLTGVTVLFTLVFVTLFGLDLISGLANKTEAITSSLNIETGLFLFLSLIAAILVAGIVSYGFVRFEQRGTPSNRVLSKIAKEVGEDPFQMKKENGKWIAITKENKDI